MLNRPYIRAIERMLREIEIIVREIEMNINEEEEEKIQVKKVVQEKGKLFNESEANKVRLIE